MLDWTFFSIVFWRRYNLMLPKPGFQVIFKIFTYLLQYVSKERYLLGDSYFSNNCLTYKITCLDRYLPSQNGYWCFTKLIRFDRIRQTRWLSMSLLTENPFSHKLNLSIPTSNQANCLQASKARNQVPKTTTPLAVLENQNRKAKTLSTLPCAWQVTRRKTSLTEEPLVLNFLWISCL